MKFPGETTAATGDDLGLTRRGQLAAMLPAFVLYALLGEARAAARGRLAPARWIDRQQEIALSLARGEIRPLAWCLEVERLGREVDLAELMSHVNRAQLSSAPVGGHNDPRKRYVRFIDEHGAPRRLAYGAALFDFAPQNVITPHGHRHMVSAHMVVDGAFRVRNYDRVGDAEGAMIIRPTRDFTAGLGAVSTMCSERDNIHWFAPRGGRPATTFDVVLSALDKGKPDYDIKPIDPYGGRSRPDGTIVAPIMSFEASARRYTADV